MTREEFTLIMTAVRTAYPNEKVTKDRKSVEFWWKYLQEGDYMLVSRALDEHIRGNKFPPTIAELRDNVNRKNKFNNFLPRGYDFEKLERALLMADMQEVERIEKDAFDNRIEQKEA